MATRGISDVEKRPWLWARIGSSGAGDFTPAPLDPLRCPPCPAGFLARSVWLVGAAV